MAGTVTSPIFLKDGAQLTQTVYTSSSAGVTLGQVVKLVAADVVDVAGAGETGFGVAIGTNYTSRTMTDNVAAAGSYVTVLTRGIVNVTTDTSAILVGSIVKSAALGTVTLDSSPTVAASLGIALDANSSTASTIRVKLINRG